MNALEVELSCTCRADAGEFVLDMCFKSAFEVAYMYPPLAPVMRAKRPFISLLEDMENPIS
jgi:hypothetical protein